MDRMYEEDTKSAIDSMDDEAVIWGIHSSPLTFAYENFMYDVVAHTCSQKNMNKQWYNNLAPDLKPFLKVYLHQNLLKFIERLINRFYLIFFHYLIELLYLYEIKMSNEYSFTKTRYSCFNILISICFTITCNTHAVYLL